MNQIFEQAQRYTELWADLATKMTSAALGTSSASPPEAARQMRSSVFQTMSQSTEEYLRSPAFMEMMKQSLDATLAYRKFINDALTAMHHNSQGIARQDIDSLMQVIRHLETRVLDRIEDLSARLDDLDARLAAFDSGQPRKSGGGKSAKSEKEQE